MADQEGEQQGSKDDLPGEGAAAVRAVMDELLKVVTKLLDPPQASLWRQIQGTPYSTSTKLGGGEKAYVYVGNEAGSDELLAIKLEKKSKFRQRGKSLWREYLNYMDLKRIPECKHQRGGFCSNIRRAHNNKYNILVMELLGPSLEELLLQCGGKLSLPTVLRLSEQMLHRLETLHSTNKVHGNVKPENFAVGRVGKNADTIYCIDLGDCVHYSHNGKHVAFQYGQRVKGNLCFMCINGHENIRKTRRSDIESLAYSLIYLLQGHLPWSDLSHIPKNRQEDRRVHLKFSFLQSFSKTRAKTTSAADQPTTQAPKATPDAPEGATSEIKKCPETTESFFEGAPLEAPKRDECPLKEDAKEDPADKEEEEEEEEEEVPREFLDLLVRERGHSGISFSIALFSPFLSDSFFPHNTTQRLSL